MINKNCKCTYPCSKHGNCAQCVAYHRDKKEIPGCFFPPEAEKKYDRSIEFFIEIMTKKINQN